ncbi:hypothetical protein K376_00975 [Streptomyces sp. PsTaAH-130]|nr:hypothetical protein K376_00975 [Streptomyces sp. PsTaAH-130]
MSHHGEETASARCPDVPEVTGPRRTVDGTRPGAAGAPRAAGVRPHALPDFGPQPGAGAPPGHEARRQAPQDPGPAPTHEPVTEPFRGSHLLVEAVGTAGVDLAAHGHTHAGTEHGMPTGGVRVRKAAQPVNGQASSGCRLPDHPG